MKDYRWPGYAIEDGRVYETAGCDENGETTQRWRQVVALPLAALFALLGRMEDDLPPLAFEESMPSTGRILHKADRVD